MFDEGVLFRLKLETLLVAVIQLVLRMICVVRHERLPRSHEVQKLRANQCPNGRGKRKLQRAGPITENCMCDLHGFLQPSFKELR
jgi:hypothetical protein